MTISDRPTCEAGLSVRAGGSIEQLKAAIAGAAVLALTTTFALSPSVADAFPELTKEQQKCSSTFIKESAKVLKTIGKSAEKCTKTLGKETGGTGTDVADCVMTDEKGKLAKAESKLSAGILKNCSIPYPMTCNLPCQTVDDGGATLGIDDDAELIACLSCFNMGTGWSGAAGTPLLQGVFGAIQNGAAIATTKEGIKCQSGLLKGTGKVFDLKVKLAVKCIKKAFKDGATTPPTSCISDLTTDPKSAEKIAKALSKLGDAATNKCPSAPPPPFDGGQCAGLEGSSLADCIDVIVECRACRWINGVIGGEFDCDAFDDGLVNGSCNPGATPPTTSTTSTTTSTTSTTLQLSCSVEQPCAGGVECCGGTCLPPDSLCTGRCSVTTDEACSSDADCGAPNCSVCWLEDPNQTCVQGIIVPNHCGGFTCLTNESCCGISCCRNDDEVYETCTSGVCVPACRFGTFACGIEAPLNCCADFQLCLSGECKTSCGTTSCFPDTEWCCGDVCCDRATQICGPQPGTCVARQTCTGTDVYIPSLDICCAEQGVCGANTACCDLANELCDIATDQCVPRF